MSDDVLVAWIGQAAPLATLLAVLVLLLVFRRPIAALIDRATRIGIAGVIEVSAEPLRTAQPTVPVPASAVRAVDRRVQRSAEQLRRMRVLWVDDHPEHNRVERGYLRDLGVVVGTALSTTEAMALLDREDPTVVVTDIARGDQPTAGLELAVALAATRPDLPVIGYVMTLKPGVPPGFFGLTNRPDRLIHLLLDVADRQS